MTVSSPPFTGEPRANPSRARHGPARSGLCEGEGFVHSAITALAAAALALVMLLSGLSPAPSRAQVPDTAVEPVMRDQVPDSIAATAAGMVFAE